MTKEEIRKYYLNMRKSLSSDQVSEYSNGITQLITNEYLDNVNAIHVFIPIVNSREINTWGIIKACWERNIRTATSITHFNPKRLTHSWFNKETQFSQGLYDVPVPNPTSSVDLSKIDMVIVPLLCVDSHGNRIGYGQGFYDSFLAQLPSATRKIGVSLFDLHPDPIQKDPWDVKLDGAVLPYEVIQF